ncbi:glycosyl transferase [Enterococcus faecium]|uniref:sugar transferase n=1 Tax=Enterococcus faecium TaxID=1352 RepID=UPI000CF290DB|nr:sugar transferase [Enterococcus faecium]MBE9903786.1 sugar transferase [Enterococcus faecium]PQG01362.1 glycosyl transferase [Enterococcus faecium]PQG42188.1 glycosyl transferase [Enterococcus faecium]
MRKWEDLPKEMKNVEIRYYYDILSKKKFSLVVKRVFDILVSATLLLTLSWLFFILAIVIKIDSPGPVFYRQERITRYGKKFKIYKFRTMVINADKDGTLVTVKNDDRITRVGKVIRKYRLDEISQLINVLVGDMSFVGTRPEVEKYVKSYSPLMLATLLLPAGITSETSILYKDEDKLLHDKNNIDKTYIEKILPSKMYYNLKSISEFSCINDLKIMCKTIFVIFGKEYQADLEGEREFINQIK